MATSYNVGDLVWAKMKGFSPWPAKVVEPPKDCKRPSLKKPMQCVFFFGTDNYAWVQDDFIQPYYKCKDQYMKSTKKSGSFKEAIEAIDDYVRTKPKNPVKSSELPSIDEELATIKEREDSLINNTSDEQYFLEDFMGMDGGDNEIDFAPMIPAVPSENDTTLSSPDKTIPPPEVKKKKIVPKKVHRDNSLHKGKRVSTDSSGSGPSKKRPRPHDKASSGPTGNGTLSHTNSVALTSTWSGASSSSCNSSPGKSTSLLSRPTFVPRPGTPPLDVECMSDILRGKNVVASPLKFGFLGLGIMGRGIVKNLINSGHQVTVWNRTPSKCRDFVKAGASKAQTPADVVSVSDVTFCCVSDPASAKEMVFGNCGILQEMGRNKGLVEMTSIDHATSQDICDAILARGGRYLEAPVSGSKEAAEDGTLIILAAGDRTLFNDCETCFQAMGNQAFYLGDVGNGCRLNLIISLLLGTTLASLAEAMALAERAGLSQKTLVDILELGDLNCAAIVQKGKAILKNCYDTNMPLQHIQKDLRLALTMGDQLEQQLPLAAAACEVFKHAKRMGYSEHDVSAVYLRARF